MSRIRLKGSTTASVPTPPVGRASLFFDDSDNALKIKLSDGSVTILGMSEEYIQDLVGNLFTSSTELNIVYDDNGNIITITLQPNFIDDYYIDKISPTKIIDNQNGRYENSIITNDNVLQNIFSLDCSIDGIWMVELNITCRRIGGIAGSPGDGATFKRTFRVKSISSSVTVHDLQSDFTSRDNPLINVSVSVSGTNVIILVKGLTNNNFKWNADIISSVNT